MANEGTLVHRKFEVHIRFGNAAYSMATQQLERNSHYSSFQNIQTINDIICVFSITIHSLMEIRRSDNCIQIFLEGNKKQTKCQGDANEISMAAEVV